MMSQTGPAARGLKDVIVTLQVAGLVAGAEYRTMLHVSPFASQTVRMWEIANGRLAVAPGHTSLRIRVTVESEVLALALPEAASGGGSGGAVVGVLVGDNFPGVVDEEFLLAKWVLAGDVLRDVRRCSAV